MIEMESVGNMVSPIDILRYIVIIAALLVWWFSYDCQSRTRTPDVMERFRRDKGRLIATFTGLPPKKYLNEEQFKYYNTSVNSMYIFLR